MRKQANPIRNGKPCMTNLPPELGRMIIGAIKNHPPFDRAKLERECARADRRLKQIIAEIDRNEASTSLSWW